jgi:hypothetical protein
MTEPISKNLEILNQIKDEIHRVCERYKFDFTEDENLRNFKDDMKRIIMKNCDSAWITTEINKTGLPDAWIISSLQNEGIPIYSIEQLKEVTSEWVYDKETYTIKFSTRAVFVTPIQATKYVINLELPNKARY